jgi:hypothetical protein
MWNILLMTFANLQNWKKVLNENMDCQFIHGSYELQAQAINGESSHGFMKI